MTVCSCAKSGTVGRKRRCCRLELSPPLSPTRRRGYGMNVIPPPAFRAELRELCVDTISVLLANSWRWGSRPWHQRRPCRRPLWLRRERLRLSSGRSCDAEALVGLGQSDGGVGFDFGRRKARSANSAPSAMEKQLAWAAAISSSGVVPESAPSKRVAKEYLASFTRPSPWRWCPCLPSVSLSKPHLPCLP